MPKKQIPSQSRDIRDFFGKSNVSAALRTDQSSNQSGNAVSQSPARGKSRVQHSHFSPSVLPSTSREAGVEEEGKFFGTASGASHYWEGSPEVSMSERKPSTLALPCAKDARWKRVDEFLQTKITGVDGLKRVITDISRTSDFRGKPMWNLETLDSFLDKHMRVDEWELFVGKTLPFIAQLARDMPHALGKEVQLLAQGQAATVVLTQYQCAVILAGCFFCVYDDDHLRETKAAWKDEGRHNTFLPSINFYGMYMSMGHEGPQKNIYEKLKCILHYFERIRAQVPTGKVKFVRKVLEQDVNWGACSAHLCSLDVRFEGGIEDDAPGAIEADFANKSIGGGVLRKGCVQEEIRFLISPECIVSRLFTETMLDNEAVDIIGSERFCNFRGYMKTFEFAGDHVDQTPYDDEGFRRNVIAAMDAISFGRGTEADKQFLIPKMERECNKAYIAFMPTKEESPLAPVATGNWGCGAFNGDKQLKSIIQLLAASAIGRDVIYFTFRDKELTPRLKEVYELIRDLHVGAVWQILIEYSNERSKGRAHDDLFTHIRKSLS